MCTQSILCPGCDIRFSQSEAIFPRNTTEFRKIEKHHIIHNKDYTTYERRLYDISSNQIYYEVHFINELDRFVKETNEVIPSTHNITIDQYLTHQEAINSTECYACCDVSFIIYEMQGYRHSALESYRWGR